MGCWRDALPHAIQSVDEKLDGYYLKRVDAFKKCANLTCKLNNSIFALGEGGLCRSSKDAEKTYWKYGPSAACKENGKGGKNAYQVYRIDCSYAGKVTNLGCWTVEDSMITRVNGYRLGQPIRVCAEICCKLRNSIFALEGERGCRTTKDAGDHYWKWGPSTECKVDGKGGYGAMQVYKVQCNYTGTTKATKGEETMHVNVL